MNKNNDDFLVEHNHLMEDIKSRKKKVRIYLFFFVFLSLGIGILKGMYN